MSDPTSRPGAWRSHSEEMRRSGEFLRAAVTPPILSSADALGAAESTVGGKAGGLAELGRIDVDVPPWFVVTDTVFQGHLDRGSSAARVDDELHRLASHDPAADDFRRSLEYTSRLLARGVERTLLTDSFRARLAAALKDLGDGPVAVRSSMAGEDSAAASFAGQLESFLFRDGLEEVVEALKLCWASAFSPRVLQYRMRQEQGLARPHMGVVIQRMVHGEVSGVAFTAHPVTGVRHHILISAAYGVGEGIVGGVCNTDDYVWDAQAGVELEPSLAHKDVRVEPAPAGAPGTVELPVPLAEADVRCLTPTEVADVADAGTRIAAARGCPQDIEFTFRDGRLYLLQARPITKLPVPVNTDGPERVFDNSNIQESYCGVTTPLTFTFACEAYASVYAQTMRAVGLPESTIDAHRDMLRNMLGLVQGRVYYNIANWYRGLLLLPSFGRNKADMEAMMGLTEPVDFVQDEALSVGEKLGRLPRLVKTAWRLWRRIGALDRAVPAFLSDFEAAYEGVDRGSFGGATFSELMGVLDVLRTRMLDRWSVPILNDFAVMMSSGRLRRMLEAAGAEDLYIPLMGGEEGIESTEPTRMLLRLARDARSDEGLKATIEDGSPEAALARLEVDFRPFAELIHTYIERYGDRVMGELKLETITLREDPAFVIRVLRNYLRAEPIDPDAVAARERAAREAAEKTLLGRVGVLKRGGVRRTLKAARTAVKHRENMRLARTRMFGLYRDVFRALGERLEAVGRLDAARDVFYLCTDDLLAYHEGRSVNADLAGVARARAAEFATYEDDAPGHRVHTRGPVYHGNRFEPPRQDLPMDARTLRGVGCYPGIVDSTLKVILSPNDELDVGGQILTTLRTDPGWAPLFPTAAGILVERGSTLSHSAVVARELGIPAVVGVPGLLAVVQDGEPVRLDGAEGTVERLSVGAPIELPDLPE
jgi:rifampicin phosphotransferase